MYKAAARKTHKLSHHALARHMLEQQCMPPYYGQLLYLHIVDIETGTQALAATLHTMVGHCLPGPTPNEQP
jgi:hypothetical protein